ncbi:MAG: hypothetical protein ACLPSW_30375 [Roseiarcus sp.]|jgi:hypothetical protein
MFQNALISFDIIEAAGVRADAGRCGDEPAGDDIFPHAAGVR